MEPETEPKGENRQQPALGNVKFGTLRLPCGVVQGIGYTGLKLRDASLYSDFGRKEQIGGIRTTRAVTLGTNGEKDEAG